MTIDAATLRLRYPAFANVADPAIAYWLGDAGRIVPASWGDDQEPATLALAAHNMARSAVPGLALGEVGKLAALGVTDFKSGTFQAKLNDAAVTRVAAGGYASTTYGQDFLDIARRNVSTFGVTAPGPVIGDCSYRSSLLGDLPC